MWVIFASIRHEEAMRRMDDHTVPFKDVTTQETATAPGNLAADLVFVSFEKVQLLLCHLECQVLTPRGGRDIECSSKTLSSPHRMQSARLLCSVSERATNFTVQKLFVQPETGIRHPRTIFSSHFLIYWGMPGQKKCNRSNHISPSNRKMLQCHYQMRNYSYFLLKLSCCNSSDSESSSDCSEYFGSYWTPLSKVKKKIKLQQLFVLKGFTACSSLLRRMGAPTACNRLTSTSLICNVLDYWPLCFCEGAINRHAKAIKKIPSAVLCECRKTSKHILKHQYRPLSFLRSVFFFLLISWKFKSIFQRPSGFKWAFSEATSCHD